MKSTIMTIAAGALAADAGTIEIDGKKARTSDAERCPAAGARQTCINAPPVLADLTVAKEPSSLRAAGTAAQRG